MICTDCDRFWRCSFSKPLVFGTLQLPEHNPDLKYQVLMLLDEFAALGRIPIIAEAVAFLPGYNVRVVPVFQSFSQLRETFMGRTLHRRSSRRSPPASVFAPKDGEDAKDLSEELGYVTVKARSLSRPRFAQWGGKGGSRGGNITVSEQRRAAAAPGCKEIGVDQAIVFYEGLPPILAEESTLFRRSTIPIAFAAAAGAAGCPGQRWHFESARDRRDGSRRSRLCRSRR